MLLFLQPNGVNDQLAQLYLDLEIEGHKSQILLCDEYDEFMECFDVHFEDCHTNTTYEPKRIDTKKLSTFNVFVDENQIV